MLKTRLPAIAAVALTLVSAGAAGAQAVGGDAPSRERVAGMRFTVDTDETPAPGRGALTTFAGVGEFAAGRGRLDVTWVRPGPTLAINDVVVAAPAARPGDYYLFDSTGFVLVRPAARTYTRFVLSDAAVRQGDVRDDGDAGFFEFGPLRADTLAGAGTAPDPARLRGLAQHGPVAIEWHVDRRLKTGPVRVLARGRLTLVDAPAGEASVVRWFGAAAALAAMPGRDTLPPDSVQVTAVVSLRPPGEGRAAVNLIVLHALTGFSSAAIDPARLAVPPGYSETRGPGAAGAGGAARGAAPSSPRR